MVGVAVLIPNRLLSVKNLEVIVLSVKLSNLVEHSGLKVQLVVEVSQEAEVFSYGPLLDPDGPLRCAADVQGVISKHLSTRTQGLLCVLHQRLQLGLDLAFAEILKEEARILSCASRPDSKAGGPPSAP